MKSKQLYPGIFSRHALAYKQRLDDVIAKGEARGRLRVIELVHAEAGMRILDVACGPGTLTRLLAERVRPDGEVVGVDLAPGMIELARAADTPNASFAVTDMERLDFPDGSFDAVVCGHGLQFAPDLERALREACRVLRPEGAFVASVPAATITGSVWELIDSVVDRWLPPAPEVVDEAQTRAAVQDAAAFEAAALHAGFAPARVETIDEEVVWESADKLVSMLMGWWDFAYRIEGINAATRQAFMADAIATIRRDHPGVIKTRGCNLVLFARAG